MNPILAFTIACLAIAAGIAGSHTNRGSAAASGAIGALTIRAITDAGPAPVAFTADFIPPKP